jgi:predicted outer membrane repeat protein
MHSNRSRLLPLLAFLACAPTARADYFVQAATAGQGRTSSSFDKDHLCNLAEAIDSVKRGRALHGCVGDGTGDGKGIWLEEAVLVNGQWQIAVYKLNQAAVINGTLHIQTLGNSNAAIEGSDGAGVFVVNAGATLDLRYVTVQHGRTKGRVITNRGTLNTYRSAIQNGNVQGLTGTDGLGGGLYNDTGFATLTTTTVQNNTANSGGGIYSTAPIHFQAKIMLENSTVNNNTATADGGGLYTNTDAILNNSTVSTNHADGNGGGILSTLNNYLEVTFSTIAFNSAFAGGGVYELGGSGATRTDYSIVSENVATSIGTDYFGNPHTGEGPSEDNPYTSLFGAGDGLQDESGYDMIGVDPALFPLDWNGAGPDGGTKTHAIAPWSWALDAGPLGTDGGDQRGFLRYSGGCDPVSGYCRADLGAYELQQ